MTKSFYGIPRHAWCVSNGQDQKFRLKTLSSRHNLHNFLSKTCVGNGLLTLKSVWPIAPSTRRQISRHNTRVSEILAPSAEKLTAIENGNSSKPRLCNRRIIEDAIGVDSEYPV